MPPRFPRPAAAAVALAALLAAAGCGGDKPKLVPVTGKVVHKGEPLTAGSIWFNPDAGNAFKGDRSSCQLQADGSFVMRTYPWGDGVPPGTYKVTLSQDLATRIKLPQYVDPARTPLTIEVPADGVKDRVFEVK